MHRSALDTHRNLGSVTTTSALFHKIPGRVGDSPILGARLWLDDENGSTDRGEANLLILFSHAIVEALRRGMGPKDATLEACKRIAARNRDPRLRDSNGRPNFDVKFYCVSKDERFAGSSRWASAEMAVPDGEAARLVDCSPLYEEARPG